MFHTTFVQIALRTSFHKGVSWDLNILIIFWAQIATKRGHALLQMKNYANFKSNRPLVWWLLYIKSGWGNSIPSYLM